jgi:hypothetical protein
MAVDEERLRLAVYELASILEELIERQWRESYRATGGLTPDSLEHLLERTSKLKVSAAHRFQEEEG